MAISAEMVTNTLMTLGGDPADAIKDAQTYSSITTWVRTQQAQSALAGAAAMAIPGLHLVGIAADLAFLMHKLSYCVWGIGSLKGYVVLGESDFLNVLALWSGATTVDELPHRAISKAALEAGVIAGATHVGGLAIAAILSQMTAQQLIVMGTQSVSGALFNKALGKYLPEVVAKATSKLITKAIGKKLAAKLAVKFSAKLGTKVLTGIIPLLGPATAAGINTYFLNEIAKAADLYYSGGHETLAS